MKSVSGNHAFNGDIMLYSENNEGEAKVSSYDIIRLLLEGALERITQAQEAYVVGRHEQWNLYLSKAIGIVTGLKMSLDLKRGGDIAHNLDQLYEYMLQRLMDANEAFDIRPLQEVGRLVEEIKSGWDGIAEREEVRPGAAA